MKNHVIANGQFCIKRNFTRYYNNVLLYRAAFSPAAAARLPFALGWTCGSWFVVRGAVVFGVVVVVFGVVVLNGPL